MCRCAKKSEKRTPANSVKSTREELKEEMKQSIIIISISNRLDSVLAGPLAGCGLVACAVSLVDVSDFRYEWIVRVGVCEHRADREEDCVFVNEAVEKFKREIGVPFEIVKAGDH